MKRMNTISKTVLVVLAVFLGLAILQLGLAAETLEMGRVTIDDNWKTVRLNNYFRNPVVVAKPLSYEGSDPALVRIQKVGSRSFQIRVQEWDYLDDTHTEETVSYMVADRGRFTLSSGMRVEAGTVETDATGDFERVRFSSNFRKTPVVFSSVATYNGEQAAVTRNRNISRSSFEVMMQEEEANDQVHAEEIISYIAMEPSRGSMSGRRFEVDRVSGVDENFQKINFGFGESTTVKADEEHSKDDEKGHAKEEVGYFAVRGGPRYFVADMQTTNGADVASLRYGGEEASEEDQDQEGDGQARPPSKSAPRGIIIEPPSQPNLDISVRTDRYQYPIGSNVQILLDLSQRAYVYVFNYDTEGQLRLIFPNRYSQQNQLSPGRYELPDGSYNFSVTGPPGVEFVQAVATTKKVEINRLLKNPRNPFGEGPYPPVADPQKLDQEFRSRLEAQFELQIGGDDPKAQFRITPVSWNSDTTSFRVGGEGSQPNERPVAEFSYNPGDPRTRERVNFSAQSSYDPDGSIVNYRWDFNGDGRTDTSGRRVSHRFSSSGQYNVRLTVEDNDGATSTTTRTVRVGRENQQPTARFNYDPSQPESGERITFDGSNSSDPDGNIASYRWDFTDDGFTDSSGRRVSYTFDRAGSYDVTLTVVDDDGARSSTTQTVRVEEPKDRFGANEPDSFSSNGQRRDNWRWLSSSHHYGQWEWYRMPSTPRSAFVNLEFLVTNRVNGGSGHEARVGIRILDTSGNVVERGDVSLDNPFRPQVSDDTDGVGYKAYGTYQLRNLSRLRNGFKVRVEWPPRDNRNLLAVNRDSLLFTYTN